jgi:hypothetical protein
VAPGGKTGSLTEQQASIGAFMSAIGMMKPVRAGLVALPWPAGLQKNRTVLLVKTQTSVCTFAMGKRAQAPPSADNTRAQGPKNRAGVPSRALRGTPAFTTRRHSNSAVPRLPNDAVALHFIIIGLLEDFGAGMF